MKEKLDSDQIKLAITPKNLKHLAQLDIFESISSTNSYLLSCARAGAPAAYVCFAEKQTKGRGRFERKWSSPASGNLYFSLLWRFPVANATLSALSLAVGVGICKVLKQLGLRDEIGLKWPNDVLLHRRKVAGILLESCIDDNGALAMVIGIGINLTITPVEVNSAWIDLQELQPKRISRNDLAGLIVNELLSLLPLFAASGFTAFQSSWSELNVHHRKKITIVQHEKNWQGIMRGVGTNGELILEIANGEILTFQCGEVSLRGME